MRTTQVRPWRRSVPLAACCALSLIAACASDENSASTSNTLPEASTTTTVVATTVAATTASTVAATTTTRPEPTTTTAAPTTTVAPTTTTMPPGASLSLRSDGIADAIFGTNPDETVKYISAVIGDPVEDSGWVDAISRSCPGTQVRFVRWGDLILRFGDESRFISIRRHFFGWSFGPAAEIAPTPAGLATPEGISIGSSVVDIGRAYPSATLFEGDELATASAQINDSLFAFVTDTRDSGVVTALLGGQDCGE